MKKIIALFSIFYYTIACSQNLKFRRDSLYQQLKQAQTHAGQVKAWVDIGEYYGYARKLDSLQYATAQMLKIASGTHQDSLFAKAYVQIGNYFSNTSDYKQALENKFKSLSFAEKAKSNYDIYLATKEVGVTFKRLKTIVKR